MPRLVVVGGGVVGTMVALFATREGWRVTQLERESAARGASVRTIGLIWVSGRREGDELAFALRARDLWEDVAELCPGVGFRANGSITILRREDEVHVAEQVLARGDAEERRFALLDAPEVRRLNPAVGGELLAGLHCALDGAVEPRLVLAALQSALAESHGYEWLPGRHVVSVSERGARDHTGEAHTGDVVLLCPGASHRGPLGWDGDRAPLRRVRVQMLETEPLAEAVTTSLADGDSLRYHPAFDVPALAGLHEAEPIVAEHRMQLLLQQRFDGSLTIGDTHAYDEPFDVAVEEAPYEHLVARAEAILGRPLPPVRRRWAGVHSQAIDDRLFHCEQIASHAWVVTGAGGGGMTLSPAIAERVLDLVGVRSKLVTLPRA